MKKMLVFPVVLLMLTTASAESRLFVSLGAGFMRPADSGFRQIYGNQVLLPEVSGAFRLYKGLCLTAGAGKVSEEGKTPELGLATKASQGYISVGLGYMLRVSHALCVDVNAGIAGMSYREEALGAVIRGRGPGYKAEAGILLMQEDGLAFIGLRLGYLSAGISDLDSPIVGPQSIKLGGAKITLCFGLQLFGND
jgi:hypothetical protein